MRQIGIFDSSAYADELNKVVWEIASFHRASRWLPFGIWSFFFFKVVDYTGRWYTPECYSYGGYMELFRRYTACINCICFLLTLKCLWQGCPLTSDRILNDHLMKKLFWNPWELVLISLPTLYLFSVCNLVLHLFILSFLSFILRYFSGNVIRNVVECQIKGWYCYEKKKHCH